VARARQATAKRHIEEIREQEYGLRPDGSRIGAVNPLANKLQGAVHLLAQSLYQRDTHFVMELVQNAEDNLYDHKGPELLFKMLDRDPSHTPGADGALLVVNNERGFKPEHVKAICSIRDSTKGKADGRRYIGEKGIGFKSVFVVSPRPHVFSHGYRFRFQEDPDPAAGLGYIIPYWVDEMPPELVQYAGQTCILLPLKAEKRATVLTALTEIQPELLLFLTILRGLTVETTDATVRVKASRKGPVVRLTTGEDGTSYWLAEREVGVPPNIVDRDREDITRREISVACPLADAKPRNLVFAYLPTEVDSGLPFLVNADFLLTSSRESILEDRPWNRWLRDEIGPTAVEAIVGLANDRTRRYDAYRFIPVATKSPFFQPVVTAVQNGLRDRAVVWGCIGDEPYRPAQVCLIDGHLRSLIGKGNLPKPLQQTPPVHPRIARYHQQLRAIGVADLNEDLFLECLRDDEWMDRQSSSWYARLYHFLASQKWADANRLAGLRLLLTEDGARTGLDGQPVYWPGTDAAKARRSLTEAQSGTALAEHSMRFLNRGIERALRDDEKTRSFLSHVLGVQEPKMGTLCVNLAQHLKENAGQVSAADLIRVTRFIRDHFAELSDAERQSVTDRLPLALDDGTIVAPRHGSALAPLVLPATADPETGWQHVFPAAEDRRHMSVLSDAYLAGESAHDRDEWCRFLKRLGATDAPPAKVVCLAASDIAARAADRPPPGEFEVNLLKAFRDQFDRNYPQSRMWPSDEVITNYRPPRWLADLADGCTLPQDPAVVASRGRAVIQWLSRQEARSWDGVPDCLRSSYKGYYRTGQLYTGQSELACCLVNAAWLPTTQGPRSPRDVFADRPETRELFGDTVAYAAGTVPERVLRWLHVHQAVTTEELIEHLRSLRSRPAAQADAGVVRRIYGRLHSVSDPWSPIPRDLPILAMTPEPQWVTADQCVWPDLSDLFDHQFVYLHRDYGDSLRAFFVGTLDVPAEPSLDLYARAWQRLASANSLPADHVERAMEMLFPVLSEVARSEERPDWWDAFCDEAQIWTQDHRFAPAEQVFVPDDEELRRAIGDRVSYAWRPAKDSFGAHRELYRELHVRSLSDSEAVTWSPVSATVGEQGVKQARLLTSAAKCGLCLALWNDRQDDYQTLKRSGLLEALLATREVVCARVSRTLQIAGHSIELPNRLAEWDWKSRALYVAEVPEDRLKADVAVGIARLLCQGDSAQGLESLLGQFLGAGHDLVAHLARRHGWFLPDEERDWVFSIMGEAAGSDEEQALAAAAPETPEPETALPSPVTPQKADSAASQVGVSGWQAPQAADAVSELPNVRDVQSTDRGGSSGAQVHMPRELEPGIPRTETAPADGSRRRSVEHGGDHSLPSWFAFVMPRHGDGDDESDPYSEPLSAEQRDRVDRAGMAKVEEYERAHGREPVPQPHNQPGYDIVSRSADGSVRYIEVKSLSSEWSENSRIMLTRTQFREAEARRQDYWVYVIDRALAEDRRLRRFQDPAGRVSRFYLAAAWREEDDAEPSPTTGALPVSPVPESPAP